MAYASPSTAGAHELCATDLKAIEVIAGVLVRQFDGTASCFGGEDEAVGLSEQDADLIAKIVWERLTDFGARLSCED